ncbi:hypothetical protein LSAT2_020004, partial [Lamellibrachia satsuma]
GDWQRNIAARTGENGSGCGCGHPVMEDVHTKRTARVYARVCSPRARSGKTHMDKQSTAAGRHRHSPPPAIDRDPRTGPHLPNSLLRSPRTGVA